MEIVLQLDPAAEDEQVILNGLRDYNQSKTGPTGLQPIAVLLKSAEGMTLGGLTGRAIYDWLFIQLLYVPEPFRGQGVGTELMAKAEAFARERGLTGIWLDTFHFQAPEFYKALGYTVFGQIDDHPKGGARYFLQKRL
ncbi:MAG: GNAT family N-acetyltransferase [Devosia sp.]|nr:GNAT family N-acetyltransferase [Devosia sp.]